MQHVRGNAVVAQSGGPTAVINQSLVGVIEAARRRGIKRLLGARHGVKGILEESFVNLYRESPETLESVARTPGAALGSIRKKLTDDECGRMLEVMKKYHVRYVFYIGGNDSAETAIILNRAARDANYELRCFHVPKTIDNDLLVTDHCPGYGSAAKFVAMTFIGDNLDNRSLPGIKINVVMGRLAGFLTAASALAKERQDDGPHLIYLPERPITCRQFDEEVCQVYRRLGRCLVAVSEGILDKWRRKPFAEIILKDLPRDQFGNPQLSGSGALGDWLAARVKSKLRNDQVRIRADTLGYLQRSFPTVVSKMDAREARRCGRTAVEFAARGHPSGTIIMVRGPARGRYGVTYRRAELEDVAEGTKRMPDEFIAPAGKFVTQEFIDYLRPLVGDLPATGRLQGM